MACPNCEKVEDSYKEEPFFPPGGYKSGKSNTFKCPACGQRWFCYNDYYCLWGEVNDDLTWKFLVRNVDVPISLGGTCAVLPGYEKYAIDPVYKICEEEVFCPTLRLKPAEGKLEATEVFQWFGEYDQGNIFNYQFTFPIMAPLEKYREGLASFRIPFVGKIKSWPNENQRSGMAKTFDDPKMEKHIVYLISPDYARDYGSENLAAVSFVAGIVLLGDPNVGVIEPRYFFDPVIIEMVNDEFKKKHA